MPQAPAAVRERPDQLAHHAAACAAALGRELTAYIAGATTVQQLDDWIGEPDTPDAWAAEQRLAAADDVLETFAVANRLGLAAGWLREVGASGVDGRSPARLLREAPDETAKAVLRAAEQFALLAAR